MKNIIKVKSTEGYTIYNNDRNKTISAVIDENKEYEAKIYKQTLEYFAYDSKGREFLVGEINIDGDLILKEGFYEVNKSKNRIDVHKLNAKTEKIGYLSSRKYDISKN